MINRKFLEDLNVEKEAIDEIMKKNGEMIEQHKKVLATKEKEIEELKGNIKARDLDIEQLKKSENKVSKEDYAELQQKYADLEKQSEANIKDVTKNFMIDDVLKNSKAKNVKALKKLLDLDKVVLEDNNLKGLDEQIKDLQKSDSYLFDVEEKNQSINLNGNLNNKSVDNEPKTLSEALHQKYNM